LLILNYLFFTFYCFFFFFFFFQAEDGIRDLTVTGVQTCALPISWVRGSTAAARNYGSRAFRRAWRRSGRAGTGPRPAPRGAPPRSEERRVGKECRSRWGADH